MFDTACQEILVLNALGSAVQTGSVPPQLVIVQLQVIFTNNFFLLCVRLEGYGH